MWRKLSKKVSASNLMGSFIDGRTEMSKAEA